ncbi:DUF1284 domain-containing protein [Celeribacter neptunius]|uniref:DUF1284 domain-containing protein n=1 Tax=Celeribacter neptunius TaxID=588602 RepID=A0A1I3JW33_9RHOB|nr:DUF1284 domain-containing protein [Celeribacter neptunius]SFI64376.1 hypothetical protein SAMN04487991_0484 [Celeribacter neptunius]
MTIRLRAHHLLCMLTYVGKGYSPGFVENYDGITPRLNAGEEIEITTGPDDICAPIACDHREHCHGASVLSRDAMAARDVAALLGRDIAPGARLSLTEAYLTRLRSAFATGEIRNACAGCDWVDLCTEVAKGGFHGTRLT